jgi:hypothetical protein
VKIDYFIALSFSYAVLWCSRCKIHRFVAEPMGHFPLGQVQWGLPVVLKDLVQ